MFEHCILISQRVKKPWDSISKTSIRAYNSKLSYMTASVMMY